MYGAVMVNTPGQGLEANQLNEYIREIKKYGVSARQLSRLTGLPSGLTSTIR
jgi:hypothetical protein